MDQGKVSVLVIVFSTMVLINAGCSKQESSAPSSKNSSSAVSSGPAAMELFNRAEELTARKDLIKAKELYQRIFTEYPDFEKIDQVQDTLGRLNLDLIHSTIPVEGRSVTHEVKSGDTLGKLAKQYGTTIALIKKSNGLDGDVIRVGQKLRIWTAPFNVFVDKSQNVLLLKTGDEILKTYVVSTGKDNGTPIGEFTVTVKLENPTWYKSGAVVPPGSPDNGLGTRWMGFDLKGYGIHGTIDPESLGRQVTAGCVRMLNTEVEELYDMVPAGTKVVIVD